jgi:hypothetical protein
MIYVPALLVYSISCNYNTIANVSIYIICAVPGSVNVPPSVTLKVEFPLK